MKIHKSILLLVLFLITLNLSSCLKWAARAKDSIPQQTALDKTYDYDGKVIIIGAGASGLAAAKILQKNNVDYVVLEATDNYGGRLKKNTTLADFPIDIGAEWIHSHPLVLNKIKGKKGNEIDEDLIPYHIEKAYNWNGEELKEVAKSELDFAYNFMPESKFKNSTWYDFVDEHLATDVKNNIQYNAVVTKIDYSGDEVVVALKNGQQYKADKVLVTVPIGVLKSDAITFVPALPEKKKAAIASVTFLPGFKLMMKFNTKFYPDAVNCEAQTGEKVYYDVAFKKGATSNIFGLLATGNTATDYYELGSDQKIVDAAIKELDAMFDGAASTSFTGDYVLENWGKHEFTKGTWIQHFEEKKSNLKQLNLPLENKVYFAGEINDTYRQMGVPGAILSGYHSVDKLLTNKR